MKIAIPISKELPPGLMALRVLHDCQIDHALDCLNRCAQERNQCVNCSMQKVCTQLYDKAIEQLGNRVARGIARWT